MFSNIPRCTYVRMYVIVRKLLYVLAWRHFDVYMHTFICEMFSCSTKVFTRWMNGTCLEAPPKQVPEQDDPVFFTFFSDVQLHPHILELANTVQQTIQSGVMDILRYLAGWKKKYKQLWRVQMVRTVLLLACTCMLTLIIYIYLYICTCTYCINAYVCIRILST